MCVCDSDIFPFLIMAYLVIICKNKNNHQLSMPGLEQGPVIMISEVEKALKV